LALNPGDDNRAKNKKGTTSACAKNYRWTM